MWKLRNVLWSRPRRNLHFSMKLTLTTTVTHGPLAGESSWVQGPRPAGGMFKALAVNLATASTCTLRMSVHVSCLDSLRNQEYGLIPFFTDIKYTPCPWPHCLGQYCAFQHHAPISNNNHTGLPYTTVELNGTTYFSAPPYSQQQCGPPEYYDESSGSSDLGSTIEVNGTTYFCAPPFAQERGTTSESSGPSFAFAPDYLDQQVDWEQTTPSDFSREQTPRMSHFAGQLFENIQLFHGTSEVNITAETDDGPLESSGSEVFPYHPSKTQRPGHARRISVVISGKENTATAVGTAKRKGHSSHNVGFIFFSMFNLISRRRK
jgi:hypothetical protein